MTTITVDGDCLSNVDKLQSLLKLRFDKLSGQTITRGNAVNWAVNQQINALITPVNTQQSMSYTCGGGGAGCSTINGSSYSSSNYDGNITNTCSNPLMPFVTFMSVPTSIIQKSTTSGDTNACRMGID